MDLKELTEDESFELVAPNYSLLAAAVLERAQKDLNSKKYSESFYFDDDIYMSCIELACRFSPNLYKDKLLKLRKDFNKSLLLENKLSSKEFIYGGKV